ncbi:hypothetical protein DFH09DRAFT_1105897 [Mycena vulgaris]|nr:hypothetical protein DFH09DRAFT_1105897 [Mycena vulgaris]
MCGPKNCFCYLVTVPLGPGQSHHVLQQGASSPRDLEDLTGGAGFPSAGVTRERVFSVDSRSSTSKSRKTKTYSFCIHAARIERESGGSPFDSGSGHRVCLLLFVRKRRSGLLHDQTWGRGAYSVPDSARRAPASRMIVRAEESEDERGFVVARRTRLKGQILPTRAFLSSLRIREPLCCDCGICRKRNVFGVKHRNDLGSRRRLRQKTHQNYEYGHRAEFNGILVDLTQKPGMPIVQKSNCGSYGEEGSTIESTGAQRRNSEGGWLLGAAESIRVARCGVGGPVKSSPVQRRYAAQMNVPPPRRAAAEKMPVRQGNHRARKRKIHRRRGVRAHACGPMCGRVRTARCKRLDGWEWRQVVGRARAWKRRGLC